MKDLLTQLENSEHFDFQSVTTKNIEEAVAKCLQTAQEQLATLYDLNHFTSQNTLVAYDELLNQVARLEAILYLLFSAAPQADIREAANKGVQELSQFYAQLPLNEKLYKVIQQYSTTAEAQQLTGYLAKFLKETLLDFEQNGLQLPENQRKKLMDLQNELIVLSNEFNKNIAENNDYLTLTEAQTKGLPEDFKQAHRQIDGTYQIQMNMASYRPFMQYCEDEGLRKEALIKYLNRGGKQNMAVLENILRLRKQIAQLLGFQSYAAYRHTTLMVKQPATVWEFELSLAEKIVPKVKIDYEELLSIKRNYLKNAQAQEVSQWDTAFYNNLLMKEKYSIDNQLVKQYFSLDNVLKGIFEITEKLFGVQFVENPNASVWHEEVRYFELQETKQNKGKVIGKLYLDMYPRDNKYKHAACFPLILHKTKPNGEKQLPVAALVCNFTKPTPTQPSLLSHGDVETMFHEFGHALHVLLSESPLYSFSGTNTKRDFVEVPSQLFEAWAWHYDSLALFAKHWQTQEILPKELFDKLLAAKHLGSGLAAQAQLFYALYDLTLHDKYVPDGTENTTDVLRRVQNQTLVFPYIEGTHFQTAFGHLVGYAASYYGYMWARVYAEDIVSEFEKQGMFNAETGKKYREKVLSKGATVEELTQVVEFLGREPEQTAFLQSLRI